MKCENLQSNLPLYIDDVLSEDERMLIERHLPTCPLCRQMLSEYGELRNSLRMISRPLVPADLLSSVKNVLRQETTPPQIQIISDLNRSFSEKFFHWLMPYSVGTVVASVFAILLLNVLLTSNRIEPDFTKNEDTTSSTILLANSNAGQYPEEMSLSSDYPKIEIPSRSPKVNPASALVALTKSIVRGKMSEEEVVVVADVFGDGIAHIAEIVKPPSDAGAMRELEKAFRTNPEEAPFLVDKRNQGSGTFRVVLKIQRVDVVDSNPPDIKRK